MRKANDVVGAIQSQNTQRHDAFMRKPGNKSNVEQRDLVDEASAAPGSGFIVEAAAAVIPPPASAAQHPCRWTPRPTASLCSPPRLPRGRSRHPRTEFPDEEIAELARDIALRGILQPIVARPAEEAGRYRVLFGAKRLRAAKQAGLETVPVVIGSQAHDAYAQVAENQKRHGLTPIDLARFIRARVNTGESNAEIARRLGIDLTSVAHHLALFTLPPELDVAFKRPLHLAADTL